MLVYWVKIAGIITREFANFRWFRIHFWRIELAVWWTKARSDTQSLQHATAFQGYKSKWSLDRSTGKSEPLHIHISSVFNLTVSSSPFLFFFFFMSSCAMASSCAFVQLSAFCNRLVFLDSFILQPSLGSLIASLVRLCFKGLFLKSFLLPPNFLTHWPRQECFQCELPWIINTYL